LEDCSQFGNFVITLIFTLTDGVMKLPVCVRNKYGTVVVSGVVAAYDFKSTSNGAEILTGQTLPDRASLCSNTCNKKANSIQVIKYSCVFMSIGIYRDPGGSMN